MTVAHDQSVARDVLADHLFDRFSEQRRRVESGESGDPAVTSGGESFSG